VSNVIKTSKKPIPDKDQNQLSNYRPVSKPPPLCRWHSTFFLIPSS